MSSIKPHDEEEAEHLPICSISSNVNVDIPIELQRVLETYKAMAMDAIRNRQLCSVGQIDQRAYVVKALKRRGWLQKNIPKCYVELKKLHPFTLLTRAQPGNEYEAVILSLIVNRFPANFLWTSYKPFGYKLDKSTYRNRTHPGQNYDYSTKDGLIGCAEQQHWYKQEGVCEMRCPRFYRLDGIFEDRMGLINDYRSTQCRNFAQFIVDNIGRPHKIIDEKSGNMNISDVKFALNNLRDQLSDFNISEFKKDNSYSNIDKWQNFIDRSACLINGEYKLRTNLAEITKYAKIAAGLLKRINDNNPDYEWDGYRNLWILKPHYKCKGIGIVIKDSLEELLIYESKNNKLHYIAQKYIERPLLIYGTKFDIRQYALLTYNDSMVRIWIYMDCYLRFCSKQYSLNNMDKLVHLTNRNVQLSKKCVPYHRLPQNLMWSLENFKNYLTHEKAPKNIWDTHIFPAFCRNIIAVMLSSIWEINVVGNTFDFVGCDFMLDRQYNPFLIEVNDFPDLLLNTSVKSHISPMVQEDVIKVLIDLPKDPSASTGNWKKIYELEYTDKSNFKPNLKMKVSGHSLHMVPKRISHTRKFYK